MDRDQIFGRYVSVTIDDVYEAMRPNTDPPPSMCKTQSEMSDHEVITIERQYNSRVRGHRFNLAPSALFPERRR